MLHKFLKVLGINDILEIRGGSRDILMEFRGINGISPEVKMNFYEGVVNPIIISMHWIRWL